MQACQDERATFTPLCACGWHMQRATFTPPLLSVDGMLGSEAEFFVKRVNDFLAAKWKRPYINVVW